MTLHFLFLHMQMALRGQNLKIS